MKNFKKTLLPMLMLMLAVSTLVSCNNDDVEEYVYVPLTPAELAQQINEMRGNYEGSLYYRYIPTYNVFNDSTGAQWRVSATDSIMTIENVRLKAFATYIQNQELRQALENDSTQNLSVRLSLYRPWGTEGTLQTYWFGATPVGTQDYVVTLPLKVGEETKNVTLNFSSNFYNNYSAGYFGNNEMLVYLVLQTASIEGGGTYNADAVVLFYGKKTQAAPDPKPQE